MKESGYNIFTQAMQYCLVILLLPMVIIAGGFAQQNHQRAISRQISSFIEKTHALKLAPGIAVAVVQGDKLLFAEGLGYADLETQRKVTPETMFYIASTTKSFTALAAMLLHARGEIDLDQPLSSYLPAVQLHPPLSADEITLRDLLTHTHGIDGDGPVTFRTAYSGEFTNEQLIKLLSIHPPASTGRAFNYSNIGYNIIGLVMEKKFGLTWKQIIRREILAPLKMSSTSAYLSKVDRKRLAMPYLPEGEQYQQLYYIKSDANMHAAGGHVSTVSDLARWLIVHINSGRIDHQQVFPAAAVAETHRKQVEQDRNFFFFHRHGWGLGWDIATYEGDTVLQRNGSFQGFYSHVSFMPQQKIGVVVLTNSQLGMFSAEVIVAYIYDTLLGKPELAKKYDQLLAETGQRTKQIKASLIKKARERASRSQTLPHPLIAYVGRYEDSGLGSMEWQLRDNKLFVRMGLLQSYAEVFNGEKNQLRVELTGSGEVVTFSFEKGEAKSLTYQKREFVKAAGH